MRHIAALALALAVAAPAQADVVYNWQTISAESPTGRIVFDDSGATEYGRFCSDQQSREECNAPDPDSPLKLFEFGALTITPRVQSGYPFNSINAGGSFALFSPFGTRMDMSYFWLEIDYDEASGVSTISHYQLDGSQAMYAGATGRWVLEQAAAVPLPGTLALLGLGFAGLGYSRRTRDQLSIR